MDQKRWGSELNYQVEVEKKLQASKTQFILLHVSTFLHIIIIILDYYYLLQYLHVPTYLLYLDGILLWHQNGWLPRSCLDKKSNMVKILESFISFTELTY